MDEPPDVTRHLRDLARGHRDSWDQLVPIVYDELRRIAHRQLARERAGHTLDTTSLVHEAYLRLVDIRDVDWQDRAHFFAMSSRLMRRILIDHARAAKREKRGRDVVQVPLEEARAVPAMAIQNTDDLLALDEALRRLEIRSERQARVVECRYFAGLTAEETATALGTSLATVKRDWAFCRAWLNREMSLGGDIAAGDEPEKERAP